MALITAAKGQTVLESVSYENTGELPVSVADMNVWTKTSSQDGEIDALIKEAVDIAENEFNLTIIDKTVTAVYSSYGQVISLPFAPVKSITSVQVDGEDVEYTQAGRMLKFASFGTGELTVIYTAGPLPQGLKLAVKKAVLSAFEDRQDSVLNGVGKMPNHSRAIFKKYKNY